MRYTIKPITVEAMQWTGNNTDELFQFIQDRTPGSTPIKIVKDDERWLQIYLLEWAQKSYNIDAGCWVIFKPGNSSPDVCDDVTFKETYAKEE